METLYKYRSLKNWKFILDIFINKRLFACEYKYLNDPMEGIYYSDKNISEHFEQSISDIKDKLKICSLSKRNDDTLMWSHYSDSHKGVVLGIKVKRSDNNDIRNVKYVNSFRLKNIGSDFSPMEIAKGILTKKLKPWSYEEEVRILTTDTYVNIDITEIYFGCKTDRLSMSLLKSITSKYLNDVVPIKLKINDLNRKTINI